MISTRAKIITRRTYNRPLNEEGTEFESWNQTVARVIEHQSYLWENAKDGDTLTSEEWNELSELQQLLLDRKVAVAGRTLWLGATDISKEIDISQFNCTAIDASTIQSIVDIFWSLLNGAGVGFRPVMGTLTGFRNIIPEIEIIPSTRSPQDKGRENNVESYNPETKEWYIGVGDSAKAWAKIPGKILALKEKVNKLTVDFSEIRGGGVRLRNYGWISQGDVGFRTAISQIIDIMNKRADSLLSTLDILDIVNLLGTVLSTRRSAQIAILDHSNPDWRAFANAKNHIFSNDGSKTGLEHRTQSNNSILFDNKPSKQELTRLMYDMDKGGKGEPGLINGKAMKERAPWASLMNPCAEILLPNSGGTCNLVSIDLGKFKGDNANLYKAAKLIARANYRQSCVELDDGILQETWKLNAKHLHLCGVSLMGIVKRPDMGSYEYRRLERVITNAAYNMAKELDLPYPKNVTTVKPEGTQSKCYDSTEGMHKPLGKYIFNNVAFSKHDPLLDRLREANYNVFAHPYDESATLATLPISYEDVDFDIDENGKEVNLETAISQLERYRMLMDNYCHQNVSCTISYDTEELSDIVDWLDRYWDSYVAVSFLKRNDPSKTAKDLGYPYLPQEVVSKEIYDKYISKLKEVEITNSFEELKDEGCATGACPIK